MAKVKQPFLSLASCGSFGGVLVFGRSSGSVTVYTQPVLHGKKGAIIEFGTGFGWSEFGIASSGDFPIFSSGEAAPKKSFGFFAPSCAQILQRLKYNNSVHLWRDLSSGEKADFTARAQSFFLTGFNYFSSIFLKSY